MNNLILQHTEDEGPGSLIEWHESRKIPFTVFKGFTGASFPALNSFKNLIVLGGPMNVDEDDKYPWLKDEKRFIASFLETKKGKYLGLCLGGQLLARAVGASVRKNPVREIGWHEVHKTNTLGVFEDWPVNSFVYQYHQDTFDLPPGCTALFTSAACKNQAFSLSDRAIGFQFHPESSAEWIELCVRDLELRPEAEPYVQAGSVTLAETPKHLPSMRQNFFGFLDRYLS